MMMKRIAGIILHVLSTFVWNGCIRQGEDDNCFTVTYDLNAPDVTGDTPVDPVRYLPGKKVTVLDTDATRPNHTFAGWNTRPDGSGTFYRSGDSFSIRSDTRLYGQWLEAGQALIVYDPNGGTGGMSDPAYSGTLYTVRTADESHVAFENHEFTVWNTEADGSGTVYLPGDAFRVSENLTLYAQWREFDRFVVIYDPNGGTGGSVDEIYQHGSYTVKTDELVNVLRENYTFSGWNTDPEGSGTPYWPGDIFTVTEDITLYAQWTENEQVTLIYDANGGTGGSSDRVHAGSSYTVKTAEEAGVQREYYDFVAWNTMADGSGDFYLPGTEFTVTEGLTLYAQWKAFDQVAVIYDPNGGTGGSAEEVYPGSTHTVKTASAANVERENYTFTAWNTAADGTGITYHPGATLTVTGDMTLYAQWTEQEKVTVTYDPNGGYGGHSEQVYMNRAYAVKMPYQVNVYRDNYTFTGWNTRPNGSGTAYQPGANLTVTGDITLYAQWEEDPQATITYHPNGGTGGASEYSYIGNVYSVKTALAVNVQRANYTFTGWNTAANGSGTDYQSEDTFSVTGNVTLYAQWNENPKFTVTYDANGGTGGLVVEFYANTQHTVLSDDVTGMFHAGHAFEYWNTYPDGSGTQYSAGDTFTVTDNITLYAQWRQVPSVMVTYYKNDNSGEDYNESVTLGDTYFVKNDQDVGFSRPGYTFTGWNEFPNGGGTAYTPGSPIAINTPMTLYAQWEQNTVTITYISNGGTGSTERDNAVKGSVYTIRSDVSVGFSRLGYTFTGWNTQPNGTGVSYAPGALYEANTDLTLYAQWKVDQTVTITYIPNEGNGSDLTDTVLEGSIYSVKNYMDVGFSRTGYRFAGWNTTADGSGTSYAPGATHMANSSLTLYAQWEQLKIFYYVNGGVASFSPMQDSAPVGENYTILSPASLGFSPPSGFHFTEWNTSSNLSGTSYTPGQVVTFNNDWHLYAMWISD